MASTERNHPYGAYNFQVNLGDGAEASSVQAGFSDVSGLGTEFLDAENRNGNDHIHIAAVLADGQGTPRVPWNDYRTARAVCQELEAEWGLTTTAGADRTAHRGLTRGETERATREGLTVPVRRATSRI